MRNRKQQGFTLIELLIVIAIIGILAAVLIPNLLSARNRAFESAATACASSIATAQEIYQIDNSTYTATSGNLDGLNCDSMTWGAASATASTYSYTVNHTSYTAGSVTVTQDGIQ